MRAFRSLTDRARRHGRRALPPLALAAAALVLGAGWDMSGPQSTLDPAGPVARMQRDVFYVTLWVAVFIFVTVGSVLAWVQWRFRARPENENDPIPEQTHGKPAIEIGLIFASIALLVVIAVPTVKGIRMMTREPAGEDVFRLTATGYQWWFRFDYPDHGFATGNEMVIPAGRPVRIDLRTMDVNHSFWIPRLAGKIDMIANRGNWMWLQADEPGYFWGHCAEFCGESHSYMRFRVVALAEDDFQSWLARQSAPARSPDPAAIAAAAPAAPPAPTPALATAGFFAGNPRAVSQALIEDKFATWRSLQSPAVPGEDPARVAQGRQLFTQLGCIGCHTVRGHEGAGITGPDLTHFASRTTVAAAVLDNTPANLRRWLRHSEEIKPGNLMWAGLIPEARAMTDDQADALVAYLRSLR